MRVSCNGCRILRKGCSEDCSIRPCLEWIKSGESQANATVFLAKFYGRAGLLNLLNAGPEHIRPAIFRSLLYEACGRIINPIYGSVGLLWSGRWQLCQAAVEAILRGDPITPIPAESDSKLSLAPLHKASSYDIRHISRALDLKRVNKRTLFKRPDDKGSSTIQWMDHGRELQGGERGKEVMISMERRESEVELELTLGYESVHHGHSPFRGSSSSSSS